MSRTLALALAGAALAGAALTAAALAGGAAAAAAPEAAGAAADQRPTVREGQAQRRVTSQVRRRRTAARRCRARRRAAAPPRHADAARTRGRRTCSRRRRTPPPGAGGTTPGGGTAPLPAPPALGQGSPTPETGAPGSAQPAPLRPSPPAPQRLQALTLEFEIRLSRTSVPAGDLRLEFNNSLAEDPHDLNLRRLDGTGATIAFDELQPGEISTRAVKLDPGTYRMWCSLSGHEQLGMRADLAVTGS